MISAIYWGKYNVTREMYPPLHRYPRYCNGQCAMMNQKALAAIANETRKTSMHGFRIEDIFYTGVLREKANIPSIIEFDRTSVQYGELKQGMNRITKPINLARYHSYFHFSAITPFVNHVWTR